MPLPFPVEVCCSGEFVALTYPSPTRQQQAAARRVPITFDCYTKEEAWARCNEPIGWESVYPALSPLESEKKVYTTITLSIVLARERSGVNAQLHPQGYLCRGLLTEANQFLQSLQLGPIACTSPTIEPESITARSIRIRFPQSLSQICNIMGLAGNSDQLRIIESLKANEVRLSCQSQASTHADVFGPVHRSARPARTWLQNPNSVYSIVSSSFLSLSRIILVRSPTKIAQRRSAVFSARTWRACSTLKGQVYLLAFSTRSFIQPNTAPQAWFKCLDE